MRCFPTPFGHLPTAASILATQARGARARAGGMRKGRGDEERDVQHPRAAEPADQPALGRSRLETTERAETSIELSGPREDEARIQQRGNDRHRARAEEALRPRRRPRLVVSAPGGARVDVNTASADVRGRGASARSRSTRPRVTSPCDSRRPPGGEHRERRPEGRHRRRRPARQLRVGRHHHRRGRGRRQGATASGDIVIRSVVQGRIDIQSASGDVEVGIRRGSKVFIDASSTSGDMSSDLDITDAPPSESDGPNIDFRARTMSGDVKVRRA